MRGAITGYIDVAQLALYAFFIFFAGLILYLRREDKREGYPLKSERSGAITVQGFPPVPSPKSFLMPDGRVVFAPRAEAPEPAILARPAEPWPGAPLVPTGNPLVDAVGPAAYAQRADVPDFEYGSSELRIVPLRADAAYFLSADDPDPRGMTVFGADLRPAGTVTDAWIDRTEDVVRYLEVALDGAAAGRNVLVPMNMLKINDPRRRIDVRAITSAQFAGAPVLQQPNRVTLREEDRIMAYYGGGTLYATVDRAEPVL
jgi:photosynthetic reaction center H subunit